MNLHKKTYIVILNYNVWEDAVECMESVLNSEYRDFQIIIIDNCSPNRSQEGIVQWLKGNLSLQIGNMFFKEKIYLNRKKPLPFIEYASKHTLIRDLKHENDVYLNYVEKEGAAPVKYPILFVQTGHNLGFAGGNNVVLRNIINSGEDANVLLLNPDTFLERRALLELNNSSVTSETFLMGLRIKDYKTPAALKSIGGSRLVKATGRIIDIKSYEEKDRLDYIYGGALFTDTSTLRMIGEMPEDYFLYWEESDWCYTAKQAGVSLLVCPQAVCYDKVGTSIGRGYLAEYFFTYNSMLFYRKHLKYYQVSLIGFHLVRLGVKLLKFKIPQAKAIVIALKDYLFGRRYEVK